MDVKTLCLGVLTAGDMAGYDIKKYFEQAFSHFFPASFGSIYPALSELADAGLVTVTDVAQDKRPDKKVYSITAAGREALCAALMQTEPRHKVRSEFLVLMYFAHLLPRERLLAVLDERVEEWERVLAALGGVEAQACDCDFSPGARFTLGYGLAVIQAAVSYIRAHRQELLDALETRGKPRTVSTREERATT